MEFLKGTIRNSPYIGVFSTTTEEYTLIPPGTTEKEEKEIQKTLQTKTIKTTIGNSPLIGILAKGLGKKIVVSSLIEKHELKKLKNEGIKVLEIDAKGFTALGNLVNWNSKAGIASPNIGKKNMKKISEFLEIEITEMRFTCTELVGSAIVVTNKGFICHPNITEQEFKKIEKIFGVKGIPTTTNFGDLFVGNTAIANTKGIIVGKNTSGIEMSKIDEALR
ncbi:MAG: translation initiation factor IF-6 [Candidatus Diapherotrites archaeon]